MESSPVEPAAASSSSMDVVPSGSSSKAVARRAPAWWESLTAARIWTSLVSMPLVGSWLGPWLFGFICSFVVPFSFVVKPRFRAVTSTDAETRVSLVLPDIRRNRNHLGSVHAGALFTAGELAAAMAATLAGQHLTRTAGAGRIGVLPVSGTIDYHKKARGNIGVEAVVDHADVMKAVDAEGWVSVAARLADKSGAGEEVATLKLRCNLRRFES
ncbi:hypothetical protein DFJ74DRAFT_678548 [Hyaloraphidium curvatum]|nr:hypothetical protein DFJ74DRAFT_678548 [Hyaloraphidium curvatum]